MLVEVATCYAQQSWQWVTASTLHALVASLVLIVALLIAQEARRPAMAGIPGPLLARFTDLWLVRQAMRGNRYEVVHDLHLKYGK